MALISQLSNVTLVSIAEDELLLRLTTAEATAAGALGGSAVSAGCRCMFYSQAEFVIVPSHASEGTVWSAQWLFVQCDPCDLPPFSMHEVNCINDNSIVQHALMTLYVFLHESGVIL